MSGPTMTCPGIMHSEDHETGQIWAHSLHCAGCLAAAPVLTPDERQDVEHARFVTGRKRMAPVDSLNDLLAILDRHFPRPTGDAT